MRVAGWKWNFVATRKIQWQPRNRDCVTQLLSCNCVSWLVITTPIIILHFHFKFPNLKFPLRFYLLLLLLYYIHRYVNTWPFFSFYSNYLLFIILPLPCAVFHLTSFFDWLICFLGHVGVDEDHVLRHPLWVVEAERAVLGGDFWDWCCVGVSVSWTVLKAFEGFVVMKGIIPWWVL